MVHADEYWTLKTAIQQLIPANKKLADDFNESKASLRRRIEYAIKKGKLSLTEEKKFSRAECLKWISAEDDLNIPSELRPFIPKTERRYREAPPLEDGAVVFDVSSTIKIPTSLEEAIALLHKCDIEKMNFEAALQEERLKNRKLQEENDLLRRYEHLKEDRRKGGINAAESRRSKHSEDVQDIDNYRAEGFSKKQAVSKVLEDKGVEDDENERRSLLRAYAPHKAHP